jgi:hypothetical protein
MNPDRDFTASRASLHDAELYFHGFTVETSWLHSEPSQLQSDPPRENIRGCPQPDLLDLGTELTNEKRRVKIHKRIVHTTQFSKDHKKLQIIFVKRPRTRKPSSLIGKDE